MKVFPLLSAVLAALLASCTTGGEPLPEDTEAVPQEQAETPSASKAGSVRTVQVETEKRKFRYSAAAESECRDQGGTYERRGMGGFYGCTVPYADAGKTCRKASDCEGQCRITDDAIRPPVGKCQSDSNTFGCYRYLADDGEVLGICVD